MDRWAENGLRDQPGFGTLGLVADALEHKRPDLARYLRDWMSTPFTCMTSEVIRDCASTLKQK
jgi:hypothetical protein